MSATQLPTRAGLVQECQKTIKNLNGFQDELSNINKKFTAAIEQLTAEQTLGDELTKLVRCQSEFQNAANSTINYISTVPIDYLMRQARYLAGKSTSM